MRYYILQHTDTRDFEIASTLYIEDARAILDRYYSGYIVSNGEIIESKRVED